MKKWFLILLALCLACVPALAEEEEHDDTATFVHELYETDEQDSYSVTTALSVNFDDQFSLTIPADWHRYTLTEDQTEQGFLVCYGDGHHFMFVKREEDTGVYADMTEYAMTLSTSGHSYAAIFNSNFGTCEQEFTLYTDYELSSSDCATIIPGKGIYTFYFYPADGDMEFAQTVIDTMNTFAFLN